MKLRVLFFKVLMGVMICSLALAGALNAATGGGISGTVQDQSGAIVAGAVVTATNLDTTVQQTTKTNDAGFYAFTDLPVGRYELEVVQAGFQPNKRTGLVIDVNTQLKVDATLMLGEQSEEVVVSENAVQVETESTQMGDVVNSTQITSVPLNGRSFTDLLALQPGIVPVSTQAPDSVVMAGAQVAIAPSGQLNAGNQSISGQREDANGFVINDGDVKEMMNGGTAIVPDLDSIAEFRVLTNNFDAEYGNYSGGIVNVVTKSGTNQIHGTAFEFLRNTSLDAKNYFSPQRDTFQQNQFGGTLGGPIRKNNLFFFSDYQGTRTVQGVDTGDISVPTTAERGGDFSQAVLQNPDLFTTTTDVVQNNQLVPVTTPSTVSGPNLAALLSSELNYQVTPGEPYYTPGCTQSTCVFPGAMIPMSAWSAPSKYLLQYVPKPNVGPATFSTASQDKRVRDDKGSVRMDYNSARLGTVAAYYYIDDYYLDNPYPTGQGGASVPGFNALVIGRAQLINLGDTKTFGTTMVNELRVSYMRYANNVGQPVGGLGPSLQSQGFASGTNGTCAGTDPAGCGIVTLAPQFAGVENVFFGEFTMGVPITNLLQWNNTFGVEDNFSKIWGRHTLKFGFQGELNQVNVNPNPEFNGSFAFYGQETGNDIADFLIGTPSNYNQADSQSYYLRHKYASGFAQDSWQIKPNLTLNFGVRWELMQYWSEKYGQAPSMVVGGHSQVFTTAPPGLLYAGGQGGGDPGVPSTLVPEANKFSPRLGLAYSPNSSNRFLSKILGGPGKTSIRTGYGIYYSVIQGNTLAFDEPQPPYGLSYTSPAPPLFATPFIDAGDGVEHVQPFPLKFPSLSTSITNPNTTQDFSSYYPIAGMTGPSPTNAYPYNENYFLSIERQLTSSMVLSFSYIGSQAHHLLVNISNNPGNPALCLSLSETSEVAAGTTPCGPFGEDGVYTSASGSVYYGTRSPFGGIPAPGGQSSYFSNDTYENSVGNSSYNAFEASLKHTGKRLTVELGYTYSKSIDDGSSLADTGDPFDLRADRGLSAWDLRHNFVGSYLYEIPFDTWFHRANRLTQGWTITGITRVSTGFPVTLSEDGDNSLMGSIPNGVNNHSADLPDFASGGNLDINHNPRTNLMYFNTEFFTENALGTQGNASRRFFYGPGMFNTDLTLAKSFQFSEAKSMQLRLETFNVFNHTQFFGPFAVNGDRDNPLFGQVVKAADPRLMQLAMKFMF